MGYTLAEGWNQQSRDWNPGPPVWDVRFPTAIVIARPNACPKPNVLDELLEETKINKKS